MSKHYNEAYLLPNNDYIDGCEYVPNLDFQEWHVKDVIKSKDRLFDDICEHLNLNPDNESQLIQNKQLNIRTVTKNKLIEWLENACYLLDTCCVPLLQKAVPLVNKTEKLLTEKIDDQKSIIGLQQKLLDQKDVGLKSVQSVVQTQLDSYSEVLSRNCATALNAQKIETAVRKVAEKDDRSRNVIIYGVTEKDNEVVQDAVQSILGHINEKPQVKECYRVGAKKADAHRPIKFVLSNSDHAKQVIRNAKKLHTVEGCKGVYICPDRTVEERKARRKLWDQILEKRKTEPDRHHYVKNNTVVSCDKNNKPVKTG